jgi:hypothetical protein
MNSPSNFRECKSRRIRSTGHKARIVDKFILDLGRKTLKRGARSFGRFGSKLEGGEGLRVRAVDSRNSACRPDASFANYRIMMLVFVPDVK